VTVYARSCAVGMIGERSFVAMSRPSSSCLCQKCCEMFNSMCLAIEPRNGMTLLRQFYPALSSMMDMDITTNTFPKNIELDTKINQKNSSCHMRNFHDMRM
jgi:hypothetical protein